METSDKLLLLLENRLPLNNCGGVTFCSLSLNDYCRQEWKVKGFNSACNLLMSDTQSNRGFLFKIDLNSAISFARVAMTNIISRELEGTSLV